MAATLSFPDGINSNDSLMKTDSNRQLKYKNCHKNERSETGNGTHRLHPDTRIAQKKVSELAIIISYPFHHNKTSAAINHQNHPCTENNYHVTRPHPKTSGEIGKKPAGSRQHFRPQVSSVPAIWSILKIHRLIHLQTNTSARE